MALNFPDNPGIGSVFVDTNSGFSYKWDGTVWNGFAGSSASEISNLDDISGSFDGIETTFALTKDSVSVSPVKAEQLRVVLGGVTQTALTDYTINGSNIIFTTAPIGSLTCTITQLGVALSIAVPGDGTVTPAKLSTGGPSWNTSGDLYISGIATANNGLVVGAGLTLADDVKINLGDDSDLQIVHDGSNSLIDGAGTGGVHLRSDTEIKFLKRTGSENILVGAADGSVAAFYDNTKRLETTDGGALVYGTVGAGQTALVVEGDIKATGVVTAVSFNGDLVGTAATTNSTGLHVVGVATISNINSTNVTAGVVTATTFDGTLSGNATSATTATTATNVTVADESTDTSCNVLFTTAATGDLAPKSGTNLTFDSSTGALTATSFVGDLSGNATGLTGTPNIACGTGSFTGDVDIADKIIHTGDTNTAIRFPATDTVTIETSGSEALRVDSSGRLGIGAASPRCKLEVSDGTSNTAGEAVNEAYIVGATTGSSEGILTIQSNDAMASDKGGSIAFGGRAVTSSAAGANWAFINGYKENGTTANYGGYLSFATRPNSGSISEAMRIDSSGRVAIGTASPMTDAALTLGASSEVGLGFSRTGSGKFDAGVLVTSGHIVFKGGADSTSLASLNELMRIESSGNVGVNVTNPDASLDVRKDGTGQNIQIWRSDLGTYDRNLILESPASDSLTEPFSFSTGNSLAVKIDGTEQMRIDSSGNVGIGSDIPSAKLDVNGSATFTGTVSDSIGPLRRLGITAVSATGNLSANDAGKLLRSTGTITLTIPSGTFTAGDMISIFNVGTGTTITIAQGSSTTLYNSADASTGNRTLDAKGIATIACTASNEFVISGSGLS